WRASLRSRSAAAASNVGALVFSAARVNRGNKISAVAKILMLMNIIGASRTGDCRLRRTVVASLREAHLFADRGTNTGAIALSAGADESYSNQKPIFRVNIDVLHLQHSNVRSFALQSIMLLQFFPIQMSGRRVFALLAAMQIAAIAVAAQNSSPMPSDNPFLVESALPYHLPPFDKIKDEHFVPATETGMQEQLKEVDAIATNAEKATFDNTVVTLERTGQLLDRVQRTFSNLNGADTNPARQKIETELAPKLAAHHDAILLNSKLFARVQELYSNREKLGLDPESSYLLERYYKDFVRAGAKLSDSDKEKLKKINVELATLQTQFDQNVLKEKNASSIVVDRREDLA